jgi:uncharacterized protein
MVNMHTRTVVALSIGTPSWVDIRGRQVFTSIVRPPIAGPLVVGKQGIDGNLTAVHSEHVLAFSAEHYDYWARSFGVARAAWDWCWWGENMTLAGIDENQLRIGDTVRIGDATFEVTSPRIPCFKLSWRLGQADAVLPQLMQTGWLGFHMKVTRGGAVAVGDEVEIVSPSDTGITVGDLSRLLADASTTDVARLKDVLASPALGPQAAGMIRQRITSIEDRARLQI